MKFEVGHRVKITSTVFPTCGKVGTVESVESSGAGYFWTVKMDDGSTHRHVASEMSHFHDKR